MEAWLAQAGEEAAVLVTVAVVEGSGPREAGAKMLVDADRLHGTIGGGHLELRAVEVARGMLASGEARRIERFALGPSLGQCCGGVVHLAFEQADGAHMARLRGRYNEGTWRLVALDGAPDSALFGADGRPVDPAEAPTGPGLPIFARQRGTHVMQEQDGRRWLVDPVAAPRAQLVLFGAGHVGAAIVRALAGLPCRVTWVDEREDQFPSHVPPNVAIEATDIPESVVANAPEGACFLVMTHSHALDQRLSEAILSRPGVGWFGLIGSHTKRKQFEHRLRARGIDPARIAAMECPIGLPGITGKQPAVIAASVAAQLLKVWEAQAAQSTIAATSMRLVASSERT
jgi:xanthine dehydrogenase accessory factor